MLPQRASAAGSAFQHGTGGKHALTCLCLFDVLSQEQQEQKKEQDARAKKEKLRQELLQAREVRAEMGGSEY